MKPYKLPGSAEVKKVCSNASWFDQLTQRHKLRYQGCHKTKKNYRNHSILLTNSLHRDVSCSMVMIINLRIIYGDMPKSEYVYNTL